MTDNDLLDLLEGLLIFACFALVIGPLLLIAILL